MQQSQRDFQNAIEHAVKFYDSFPNSSSKDCAILNVVVLSARYTPSAWQKDKAFPSTYVVLSMLNDKRQTKTVRNNSEPVWSQTFHFCIGNPKFQNLIVKIYKEKKTKSALDRISIPLGPVFYEEKCILKQTYTMKEHHTKITMILELQFLTKVETNKKLAAHRPWRGWVPHW